MRLRIILKRLLFGPIRRVGRTILNVLIFDMASIIYQYAKRRFQEPGINDGEEDEIVNDHIWPDFKNERRW